MIQSILAGAIVANAALGPNTIVMRASDRGIGDFTRLTISAQSVGALPDGAVDQIPLSAVAQILINGRIFYARGNNGVPRVPAGIFSPLRSAHFVRLGSIELSSSDTVQIVIDNTAYTNPVGGTVVSASMPFSIPGGAVGEVMPTGPEMLMASGDVAVLGAGVPVAIPLAVDDSGILDLSRAVVRGFIPATVGHEAIQSASLEQSSILNQILVRADQNLVVGQVPAGGVLGAPLGQLSAGRLRNFADLPAVRLAANQTVTLTVSQFSGVAGVFSWAAPFAPDNGGLRPDCAC